MDNPILYAVKYIRDRIPEEILIRTMQVGIPSEAMYLHSTDEVIISNIIRSRVIRDINLEGGQELLIPLTGLQPMTGDFNTTVFKIPRDRSMNRDIVSVMGIGSTAQTVPGNIYGGVGPQVGSMGAQGNQFGGLNGYQGNYLTNQWDRVYKSQHTAPSDYNSNVSLIGPNTVIVYGLQWFAASTLSLRCLVENDHDLNNLSSRIYSAFGHLCLLATKMYIYNTMIIKMGLGELQSGQELGRFANIIEGYESALEEYDEYKNQIWGRIAFLNDRDRTGRYLSLITNTNF